MHSRLITNLFLLILVVGLGTFLFINEEDQNIIKKLSAISAESIDQITIHHKQREIILKKSDQQWQMIKPVAIAANQFRIKTLLNLLSTGSHAQYPTGSLELEKYGLEQSETYVIFNNTKINFGIINPLNNLRYVILNSQLHLTDDYYFPLVSSQIGTLIARELLPADTKIKKLVLPEHILTRDENNLWTSTDEISSDAITEAVYQWTHKQAFAVHDYMERESLGEIQVYIESSKAPITFNITDVDPWLIIARPEVKLEYHFNIEDYDALLRPGVSKPPLPEESLQVSPDEFMNAIQSQ